ncbi:DUF3667 domain-containing protein [Psychroserpens sp. XS_ASV72]|uniref:DUF3667 domain-containing protein n=1 Tax=Psychroserpens sp. XS_ASV72 TaxID=3241293 RepID=UPI003516A26D
MANQSLIPEDAPLQCQNCEKELDQNFEFCPHCGQKTNDDLTIGVLFYNTISNYFSFDARFLKSFIPLMIKPGYLAKKFLEGKRLLYLHPAQMYLFVSVIFFFVISFSARELVQKADKINRDVVQAEVDNDNQILTATTLDSTEVNEVMSHLKENQKAIGLKDEDLKKTDSILKTQGSKSKNIKSSWDFNKKKVDSLVASGAEDSVIYKEMGMSEDAGFIERRFFTKMLSLIKGQGAGSIIQAFFDSIPISMFFLLPLFALILKLFYYNKGAYAHHLVFSFYYFSFLFTVFSILFAVNRFLFEIPDWLDWLIALSTYFYFLIALIRFYKQHWLLTWIKSGVITFVFLLFVIPTAFGILLAFSFLGS